MSKICFNCLFCSLQNHCNKCYALTANAIDATAFLQYLFFLSLSQDLTMGTPAAPQVAPPSWGAPMVNVVCVL